ncbi:MAG: hypothetical protein M1561_04185 [Gammaproteobacteria bacterium]|nr:hypothetical protein [Gammaproteobacteria bacterium]
MSFWSDTYSKWKSVSWVWDLLALLLIGGGVALIVEASALSSQPLMIYLLSGLGIAITFFSHLAHILLSEPAEESVPIYTGGEYKRYVAQRDQVVSPPLAISMFSTITWEPGEELYKAAEGQLRIELKESKVEVKQEEKAPDQKKITYVEVLYARYLGVAYMFTNKYANARNTLTSFMNIPYLTLGSLSAESKHATEEVIDNPTDEERYGNCERTVSLPNNSFPAVGNDPYVRFATKDDPVINFMLGQYYEKLDPKKAAMRDPAKAVSCYRTVVNGFKAINNFRKLGPDGIFINMQSFPQPEARMIRLGFEITYVLAALSYIEAAMKVSRLYFRVARETDDIRGPATEKANLYLNNASNLYGEVILTLNKKLNEICSEYSRDDGVIAARYLTAEVNNFFYRIHGQRLAGGGVNSDRFIGLNEMPKFKEIIQRNQLTSDYNASISFNASANYSSSVLSSSLS